MITQDISFFHLLQFKANTLEDANLYTAFSIALETFYKLKSLSMLTEENSILKPRIWFVGLYFFLKVVYFRFFFHPKLSLFENVLKKSNFTWNYITQHLQKIICHLGYKNQSKGHLFGKNPSMSPILRVSWMQFSSVCWFFSIEIVKLVHYIYLAQTVTQYTANVLFSRLSIMSIMLVGIIGYQQVFTGSYLGLRSGFSHQQNLCDRII